MTDIKNSSIDGFLPDGWEIKKLSEVCFFKSGTTINTKLERTQGDVIYAKVGDMNLEGNEDYIKVSSRYVYLKEINESQIIPFGSIIFPKRGGAIATNKKRRIIKPTIVDLNTMALIPTKIIDKDYLFFWFQQIDLSDLSNGTSIPQINNYSFDNIFISFPKSLAKQKTIVSILDEAFRDIDKAKANAEQNLKNAKELFESFLQQIFETKGDDWEEKTLGDVIEIRNGKNQQSVLSESGKYPILGSAGKVMGYANDYICEEGTTIIGRKGNINSPLYINEKFWNVDTAFGLYPKKDLDKMLLYYFCLNYDFSLHNRGTTIPSLVKTELLKIPISYPKSLTEQKTIVQKLDALSAKTKKLEAIYQKKIADLDELKKSILQKAFTGQLKPKKEVVTV